VLLGADSLETLKTTHGHYFNSESRARSTSPFLGELAGTRQERKRLLDEFAATMNDAGIFE
jgi:hypothetical protein